jgi:hypothetical protein
MPPIDGEMMLPGSPPSALSLETAARVDNGAWSAAQVSTVSLPKHCWNASALSLLSNV